MKSLYGDKDRTTTNSTKPVVKPGGRLPKLYSLESTKKSEKGSVPDVSSVKAEDVLPREVIYVLSQQRRIELIREREEDERRRRNQIVLRFGDLKVSKLLLSFYTLSACDACSLDACYLTGTFASYNK